jgi:hypothetical protein
MSFSPRPRTFSIGWPDVAPRIESHRRRAVVATAGIVSGRPPVPTEPSDWTRTSLCKVTRIEHALLPPDLSARVLMRRSACEQDVLALAVEPLPSPGPGAGYVGSRCGRRVGARR